MRAKDIREEFIQKLFEEILSRISSSDFPSLVNSRRSLCNDNLPKNTMIATHILGNIIRSPRDSNKRKLKTTDIIIPKTKYNTNLS